MYRSTFACAVVAIIILLTSSAMSATVYVKWDSPGPTFDGASWETAFHTVQEGLNAAAALNEVWVARGTYFENITLKDRVLLYGGFAGTETDRNSRNWAVNETILDGDYHGSVVTVPNGCTQATTISGFTITHGSGSADGKGGGVYVYNCGPTIQNNKITENSATAFGGGICCEGACTARLSNNLIVGNNAPRGGGIYCATGESWLYITNNTIVANNTSISGGGIDLGLSSPSVSSNIVALNTSGIYAEGTTTSCTLKNNCVCWNTSYDYSGIAPGSLDISSDPVFVNRFAGDYHIKQTSPCINRGCAYATGMSPYDMDAEARVFDRVVDIGADEFHAPFTSVKGHKSLPNGADAFIRGTMVTAAFPDYFYIEDRDRSCGIRVYKSAHGLKAGMGADVMGSMSTDYTGERIIYANQQAAQAACSWTVDPLGLLACRAGGGDWNYDPSTGAGQIGVLGGLGLNNIGLLVTVTGTVAYVPASGYFIVSDGSKITDPSGYRGVRVTVPTGVSKPADGKRVKITGVSSMFRPQPDERYPQILVRDQADIVVLD